MTDIEFNRRLFAWVLWIFAGFAILILVTSCSPMTAALYTQPATATPEATKATQTAKPEPPSPTPYPVVTVNSSALEVRDHPSEAGRHIAYLQRGAVVIVYATRQAEKEYCTTWAAIDPSLTRWVCNDRLTTGE
jgi:hypothetical protein